MTTLTPGEARLEKLDNAIRSGLREADIHARLADEALTAIRGAVVDALEDDTPDDDPGTLLPDQSRRVYALGAARGVLITRGGGPVLASRAETPPDLYDLLTVARWILTGEDPWPPDPPEPSVLQDLTAEPGVLYVPDAQVEDVRAGLVGTFTPPAPEVRPLSAYQAPGDAPASPLEGGLD